MDIAIATVIAQAVPESTPESHLWEVLLVLSTVALVVVSSILTWATLRLNNATLKAANHEMALLAGNVSADMASVAKESMEDHPAPAK